MTYFTASAVSNALGKWHCRKDHPSVMPAKEAVAKGTKSVPTLRDPFGGTYSILPDIDRHNNYLDYLKTVDGLSPPSVPGMMALMSASRNGAEWLDSLNPYLKANHQHFADRLSESPCGIRKHIEFL